MNSALLLDPITTYFIPTSEFNPPSNLSGRQIVAKVAMWLAIWGIIAALLFVVVSFIGGMFTSALGQQAAEFSAANPLLPLILLFIGFISKGRYEVTIFSAHTL